MTKSDTGDFVLAPPIMDLQVDTKGEFTVRKTGN